MPKQAPKSTAHFHDSPNNQNIMSNQTIIPQRASALELMGQRLSVDPAKLLQTLSNTAFKGANDDEMLALVVVANEFGLNPLLKELYAFPKKGGGITPMVGVDGWLKIANRQPNYDGMTVEVYGDDKAPTHATCEIFLKDRAHSVKITEYHEECKRNTDPWNQMPRRMLRNKAMIQAIRVAFGIGGIHDEDEAEDISRNTRNVTPRAVVRENPISPFDSLPDARTASQGNAEEAPEVIPPNPVTVLAAGRQKKDRIQRDATFKAITELEREGNGKTFWEVSLNIGGKLVGFSTFSETLSGNFYEMDPGTKIRVTVVPNADGKTFAIEGYALITADEEGGLV